VAYIEVTTSEVLKNSDVTNELIFKEFRAHLLHYYADDSVKVTATGVSINGHLRDAFEWGVIKANAVLTIENGELVLNAKGTVTLGKVAWLLFALGLVTGVFLLVFFYAVIMHFNSKDRPEKHLRQAFKATVQEINKSAPAATILSPAVTTSVIDALEKLGSMKERGIITNDEFSQQKQQLLKP